MGPCFDTDSPDDFTWLRAAGRFDHGGEIQVILLSVRGRFGFGPDEMTRDQAYTINRTTGEVISSLEVGDPQIRR